MTFSEFRPKPILKGGNPFFIRAFFSVEKSGLLIKQFWETSQALINIAYPISKKKKRKKTRRK